MEGISRAYAVPHLHLTSRHIKPASGPPGRRAIRSPRYDYQTRLSVKETVDHFLLARPGMEEGEILVRQPDYVACGRDSGDAVAIRVPVAYQTRTAVRIQGYDHVSRCPLSQSRVGARRGIGNQRDRTHVQRFGHTQRFGQARPETARRGSVIERVARLTAR